MGNDYISPIQPVRLANKDGELDLMQFISLLWRGKWLILLCVILGILVGGYYAFAVAVPRYTSSTTVALESRDSQVIDFESVVSVLVSSTMRSYWSSQEEMVVSLGMMIFGIL